VAGRELLLELRLRAVGGRRVAEQPLGIDEADPDRGHRRRGRGLGRGQSGHRRERNGRGEQRDTFHEGLLHRVARNQNTEPIWNWNSWILSPGLSFSRSEEHTSELQSRENLV